MILTKREKLYAIITGAVVAGFGIYYLVLDPYVIAPRAASQAEIKALTTETTANAGTFKNADIVKNTLKTLQADGLTGGTQEADTELEHAMTTWTNMTRVAFVSRKPERGNTIGGDAYVERTVQFTGTGTAYSIEELVYQIENSPYIRLNSLQVTSRQREGVDDLTVQISISTICPNPDAPKPKTN